MAGAEPYEVSHDLHARKGDKCSFWFDVMRHSGRRALAFPFSQESGALAGESERPPFRPLWHYIELRSAWVGQLGRAIVQPRDLAGACLCLENWHCLCVLRPINSPAVLAAAELYRSCIATRHWGWLPADQPSY